jgi:hypothetical protein
VTAPTAKKVTSRIAVLVEMTSEVEIAGFSTTPVAYSAVAPPAREGAEPRRGRDRREQDRQVVEVADAEARRLVEQEGAVDRRRASGSGHQQGTPRVSWSRRISSDRHRSARAGFPSPVRGVSSRGATGCSCLLGSPK